MSIFEIELLTEEEKNLLLHEWCNTQKEYPKHRMIHEFFQEQARTRPDAVALCLGTMNLNFRDLNSRANQIAGYLQEIGVGEKCIVGLCMKHSFNSIAVILGILKVGAAYMPIDPSYPLERAMYMLKDSNASRLIVDPEYLEKYSPAFIGAISIDRVEAELNRFTTEDYTSGCNPESLAYIIYTSGSTGTPKGVMVEHRNLVNYISWVLEKYLLSNHVYMPLFTSLSFDLTITSIFLPLCSGNTIVIFQSEDLVETLKSICNDQRINLIKLTPSHLCLLCEFGSSVSKSVQRTFVVGGEELLTKLAHKTVEVFGNDTVIFNEYGPTEATVGCMLYKYKMEENQHTVKIGRPAPNTRLYILDQNMKLTPIGVKGELYISGAQVSRGYINNSCLTDEKFVSNHYDSGRITYRTGDLARWLPDGDVEFLGRIDDQVKIRGYRIELGEIEACLSKHEFVEDAVVITRDNDDGRKTLEAFYIATDDITREKISNHLLETLPEYMIPSSFTRLEKMPLTSSGKVDKKALADILCSRNFDNKKHKEPASEIERVLCEIWSNLLKLQKVSTDDNFFELGGDSILAIQMSTRMRSRGYHVSIQDVFEYQSISDLAPHIKSIAEDKVHTQEPVVGEQVLSPIQSEFFDWELKNPNYYLQSVMVSLPKEVTFEKIESCLTLLVNHHDVLRLSFRQNENGWSAFYGDICNAFSLEHHILTDYDERQIENMCITAKMTISITTGPLIKAVLFSLPKHCEKNYLLLSFHHLIIDTVSWQIIMEDIRGFLNSSFISKDVQFPAKTCSFKEWMERLSKLATSEGLQQEINFWNSVLAAKNTLNDFVINAAICDYELNKEKIEVIFSEEETEDLLKNCSTAFATQINDLLLSSYVSAYKCWTGYDEMVIQLEGHGRELLFEDTDVNRTVGWFTTKYPVSFSYTSDLAELIMSVKEKLREIPNNGIGYGILKYLRKEFGKQCKENKHPSISFNYLGQLQTRELESAGIKISNIPHGPDMQNGEKAQNLIDITGRTEDNHLSLVFDYDHRRISAKHVRKLADHYKTSMTRIIQLCKSITTSSNTYSDFGLMDISREEFSKLILEIEEN